MKPQGSVQVDGTCVCFVYSPKGHKFEFRFACLASMSPLTQLCQLDMRLLHRSNCLAAAKAAEIGVDLELEPINQPDDESSKFSAEKTYQSLRSIFSDSVSSSCSTILPELEAAEILGNIPIDFQI